jgi:DNA-binding transcriptional LysR family regulator
LKITQAAASSLLAELEFLLGEPLFSRSRSGTRATVSGKMLIDRARPILSNIRGAVDEIQQARDGVTGNVYVGMLPAVALTIVPLAISITRRQKPGVRVHVIEGPARPHVDSLLRGDLDLVIGRVALSQVSGLLTKIALLDAEPYEVVCRADHALARKENVGLADVVDADWILSEPGSNLADDFHATFLDASLQPPEPVVVTTSTVLRLALLESTDMLGVLTRRQAIVQQARGTLKILNVGIRPRDAPTLVLARGDTILSAAATAFVQNVRGLFCFAPAPTVTLCEPTWRQTPGRWGRNHRQCCPEIRPPRW